MKFVPISFITSMVWDNNLKPICNDTDMLWYILYMWHTLYIIEEWRFMTCKEFERKIN